jgi:hypothetical protein
MPGWLRLDEFLGRGCLGGIPLPLGGGRPFTTGGRGPFCDGIRGSGEAIVGELGGCREFGSGALGRLRLTILRLWSMA